jgi:hypothetical protein
MDSPYPLPFQQEEQLNHSWPARMANALCTKITTRVEEMLHGSRLNRNLNHSIALIRPEIDFVNVDEKVLGSGSFSQVRVVTTCDGSRYALKHLKRSLMDRQDEFVLAAAELAVEAHMLSSSLSTHPFILKIRGWAANGIASFEDGQHNSFFLMLDLLDETLNQRIERWRDEQEHYDFTNLSPTVTRQQQQPLWRRMIRSPNAFNTATLQQQLQQHASHVRYQTLYLDKVRIVKEIASALDCVHSNRIIFRGKRDSWLFFVP